MSEYQDYFFSDAERDEEISMLNSPLMAQKYHSDYDFLMPHFDKDELPPTDAMNDVTEIDKTDQKRPQKLEFAFLKKQSRIKRHIEVSELPKMKRKQIFRGLKDDTTELNTNFRTILLKRLTELLRTRQLVNSEKVFIQEFSKGVPSFAQLKKLCQCRPIKDKGLKFIKTSKLSKQILSGQCTIQTKLTMLKYVQALKQNFELQKIIKWKDVWAE